MAVNENNLYGKSCRYYYEGYIWVPEDGSFAVLNNKGKQERLKIITDSNGKWAKHPWGHYIPIAKAVITCYCPPPPNDGYRYHIAYRDDDNTNCHKNNLYWEAYHYQHNTSDSAKLKYHNSIVVVSRDGSVKVDGKDAMVYDYLYDPDMDLHNCILPYVFVKGKGLNGTRISLDDIMKGAGYVNGDDAGMRKAEILHRDNDWMNFASDNLEWVEADDPRYLDYLRDMYKAMNQRKIELNPGKRVPDFYMY